MTLHLSSAEAATVMAGRAKKQRGGRREKLRKQPSAFKVETCVYVHTENICMSNTHTERFVHWLPETKPTNNAKIYIR